MAPVEKVALVTGGAQGIGRATALLLAGRGYRVAVADVAAAKRPEPGLRFWKCDVSLESSVRACVRGVVNRFGRLDALVNNAGLTGPYSGPVEKLPLKDWNRRLGGQSHRRVPDGEARGAAPAARARRDRQHRLHPGAAVGARHRGLRRQQGRPGRPHPRARDEPRPRGARELHQPGLDQPQAGAQEGPRAAPGRARRRRARTWPSSSPTCSPTPPASSPAQNFVIDGGMTRKMIYV